MRISDWSSDVCSSDLVANAVAEENASGTAETNNEATFACQSALAPFIDLSVSGVAVEPASGWAPGDVVTLNWTTTNSGNRPTPAGFSERILVRNASSGQQVLLANVPVAALAAGESRSGSRTSVDRNSVESGQRVSGRVDLGGRRIIKQQ